MPSRRIFVLFTVFTVLLGVSAMPVSPAGAKPKSKHAREEEERKKHERERKEEEREDRQEQREEQQEGQHQCPPGVEDANYCASGNFAGLTARLHTAKAHGSTVDLPLACKKRITCKGKLLLEDANGKALGVAQYKIKRGAHGTVHVKLTSLGLHELQSQGKLALTIGAKTRRGLRSVIGHVDVKK
jgi:hypothetical protein